MRRMVEAASKKTAPSVMLAGLLTCGEASHVLQDPKELLQTAAGRFRCISWDILRARPDIILEGSILAIAGRASSDLYDLSEPCEISACDAFLSHSWRDSATQK